jgi:hypothetical protein
LKLRLEGRNNDLAFAEVFATENGGGKWTKAGVLTLPADWTERGGPLVGLDETSEGVIVAVDANPL